MSSGAVAIMRHRPPTGTTSMTPNNLNNLLPSMSRRTPPQNIPPMRSSRITPRNLNRYNMVPIHSNLNLRSSALMMTVTPPTPPPALMISFSLLLTHRLLELSVMPRVGHFEFSTLAEFRVETKQAA